MSRSRQRKHKRRLYAKQAQHLYSSWEDLKLLSWMEDGRRFLKCWRLSLRIGWLRKALYSSESPWPVRPTLFPLR